MVIAQSHHTILRNAISLMAGRLVSRLLQFLMVIYAARTLGAEQFGVFSYAFALASLMAVFMDLGVSSYTILELSRDQDQTSTYMGSNLVIKALLAGFGLLLITGIGFITQRQQEPIAVLLLMGIYVAVESLTMSFASVFQARERMDYQAILISVSGLIMATTGLALLYFFPDLLLFSLVFVFGALLRFGLHGWWCIKIYGPPRWVSGIRFHLELLRKGIPFALVTIFVTIYYYIDTVILKAFWGNEIVGWYNAAYRLLEAPLFISQAFTTAIFPAASSLFERNRKELRDLLTQAFQKAMLLGLFVAVIVAFFAKQLIELTYGIAYQRSALVLPPLIFSVAIIFPSTILGTTIRAIGKQATSAWVTGIGAMLNVALNLIVIPYYSYQGAAWTTLATEVVVLVVYSSLVWRYLGPVFRTVALLRVLGVNGCLLGFLYVTQSLGMWLQLLGCVIIFVPLLLATRLTTMDELRGLIRIVLSRRKRISP